MHQKDIQENDPFGQNDEADEADEAEKSFLKALLAERALKNVHTVKLVLKQYDVCIS